MTAQLLRPPCMVLPMRACVRVHACVCVCAWHPPWAHAAGKGGSSWASGRSVAESEPAPSQLYERSPAKLGRLHSASSPPCLCHHACMHHAGLLRHAALSLCCTQLVEASCQFVPSCVAQSQLGQICKICEHGMLTTLWQVSG